MSKCAGCGLHTKTMGDFWAHYRSCNKLRHGRLGPPESEDAYRERMEEQESHIAEYEEARQRRLKMLNGSSMMWWGRPWREKT